MPGELSADKLRFIEKLGLYYENLGIPRIGGRLLGLLLLWREPLSAEEICALLTVSRSSVSTNLRLLVSGGFLDVSTRAGERSDYYSVSDAAWDGAIRGRIESFRSLRAIVEQGLEAVGGRQPGSRQLSRMLAWIDVMVDGHEKSLAAWRETAAGRPPRAGK
jgi:hypothetical protein